MKKIVALVLTLAFVCSLSISSIGCNKKADEKKSAAPADTKKEAPKSK